MVPEFTRAYLSIVKKLAFSNDSSSSPLKPFSNAFYYSVLFVFAIFLLLIHHLHLLINILILRFLLLKRVVCFVCGCVSLCVWIKIVNTCTCIIPSLTTIIIFELHFVLPFCCHAPF